MKSELAKAKINLCLHVVGQRDDGMHLLDSLVVFADVGDVLTCEPASGLTLEINGPFGDGLSVGPDNLVLQAAEFLGVTGAKLQLQKNLPVASGIGGGSADCAATVRLLCDMFGRKRPAATSLATLGSDVPVCLLQIPQRMMGVGEKLAPMPPLPTFWMVLVNAGDAVETGAVFKAMTMRDNAKIPHIPSGFDDAAAFFAYLGTLRNDMEAAACGICPSIGDVLKALNETDCALARMSGSGGTCFGLFETQDAADHAANTLRQIHPDWWVVAAQV